MTEPSQTNSSNPKTSAAAGGSDLNFLACPACARLDKIRAGTDPHFIREMRESFLVVHKHQRYQGWCTLWLKDHHEQLGLLPRDRQRALGDDVIDTAAAMHLARNGPSGRI